jgi:hypothetical protein
MKWWGAELGKVSSTEGVQNKEKKKNKGGERSTGGGTRVRFIMKNTGRVL